MYYAYVRSLIIDHDLDFKNEFTELTPYPKQLGQLFVTETNHIANKYPIGYSLAVAPFFLLAHGITLLSGQNPDGYSFFYDLLVPLGSLIYSLIGFYFGIRFLCRFFEWRLAFLSLATIWFSTSLVYYAAIFEMMAHQIGFACVSTLYFLTIKCSEEPKRRWYFLGGLLAGLLIVLRPTNIIYLIYPLWNILFCRSKKHLLWSIIPALGILSLQMISWKILYGKFIAFSYGDEGFQWIHPQVLNALLSPNHGLFFWWPVAVLSIIGLIWQGIKDKKTSLIFLAMLFLMIYMNASWHCWWFGDAFGARAFVESALIIAFGLAYFYRAIIKNILLSLLISVVFIGWNFYLLFLYVYGYIS